MDLEPNPFHKDHSWPYEPPSDQYPFCWKRLHIWNKICSNENHQYFINKRAFRCYVLKLHNHLQSNSSSVSVLPWCAIRFWFTDTLDAGKIFARTTFDNLIAPLRNMINGSFYFTVSVTPNSNEMSEGNLYFSINNQYKIK